MLSSFSSLGENNIELSNERCVPVSVDLEKNKVSACYIFIMKLCFTVSEAVVSKLNSLNIKVCNSVCFVSCTISNKVLHKAQICCICLHSDGISFSIRENVIEYAKHNCQIV